MGFRDKETNDKSSNKEVKEIKNLNRPARFINSEEYSQEELQSLEKLYENSFKDIKEGEIIRGRISSISGDNVVVDVGFKSDGTISREEFDPNQELKVGLDVDIVIESIEDEEGNLVLSKKRADFLKVWAKIMEAFEKEEVLQ